MNNQEYIHILDNIVYSYLVNGVKLNNLTFKMYSNLAVIRM